MGFRLLPVVLMFLSSIPGVAKDFVVAHTGAADFHTIQAAVDAVPTGNQERFVISIKNGMYNEQVRIHNSFITLRGEDRKKTQIAAEVDTSSCQVDLSESKEEHCAVVIGDGTDLVFENLTVENTFKPSGGKGAALSLVNDSTRILLHNVDVIGSGGDTLVLSARRNRIGDGGEYYLKDVYVSGTYHIIVPRGATYATNCSFWCMGGEKNCLFAEGITRESDKLVIKNSVIDGPEPFGLGSYFRDAAWYFIGDNLSDRLLSGGKIHREPAKNYQMKWGEGRIYFADLKAPAYPWLKENLATSPAKTSATVTAKWVFPQWDPERTNRPVIKDVKIHNETLKIFFDERVTVDGEPFVLISSGQHAKYVGGSGSNAIEFHFPGNGRPIRLDVNGGAIFGSAASLHHRDAALQFHTNYN